MYSASAMSQLTSMIAINGHDVSPCFCRRRCQYHANVMNVLLAKSIPTAMQIFMPCIIPFAFHIC